MQMPDLRGYRKVQTAVSGEYCCIAWQPESEQICDRRRLSAVLAQTELQENCGSHKNNGRKVQGNTISCEK